MLDGFPWLPYGPGFIPGAITPATAAVANDTHWMTYGVVEANDVSQVITALEERQLLAGLSDRPLERWIG